MINLKIHRQFPAEVYQRITINLLYDLITLSACSQTCYTWYFVAAPYLFRNVKLQQRSGDFVRHYLHPLLPMQEAKLLPFVKRVEFETNICGSPWVRPVLFDSRNLQCFRALENVQELSISGLDLHNFPADRTEECFGHFGQRLRSLVLLSPVGTSQELLNFLELFPLLNDIEISDFSSENPGDRPMCYHRPKGLKGRLALVRFCDEGLLRNIIYLNEGMWFESVALYGAQGGQLVLDACGLTVKTLRICLGGRDYCKRLLDLLRHLTNTWTHTVLLANNESLNASHNTALQRLEVFGRDICDSPPHARTLIELLSTITSPAFSEVVVLFIGNENTLRVRELEEKLREMYEVRKLQVSFCMLAPDHLVEEKLRQLALETAEVVQSGCYSFLPSPPSVFSHTLSPHYCRGI